MEICVFVEFLASSQLRLKLNRSFILFSLLTFYNFFQTFGILYRFGSTKKNTTDERISRRYHSKILETV